MENLLRARQTRGKNGYKAPRTDTVAQVRCDASRTSPLCGWGQALIIKGVSPKLAATFRPHTYSVDELRRILESAESCRRPRSDIGTSALRTLILLTYGTALRTSEALSLKICDADLSGAVLTIRDSKFYKSRLVPLGMKTVRILTDYIGHRSSRRRGPDDFFFVGRNSKRIPIHMF
jgi:integrase/recombinase XerD